MWRTASLIPCLLILVGCGNLQSPPLVQPVEGDGATSWRLLQALKKTYQDYNQRAQEARVWTDGTVLGAAGGSVIGAATNAPSDLYKATGGIALTALGLSKYANFKTQTLATRMAFSKLICAEAPLKFLLQSAGKLEGVADNVPKASFGDIAERTLSMVDTDGKVTVQNITTTIPPTDYLTLGNVVETYTNANENIDKAQRIINQINDEATSNLVGMQLVVINQIETDSFKIDEAATAIKVAPPTPVSPNTGTKAALKGGQYKLLDHNAKAVEIIESYNRYARCMKGDFTPTTF